MKRVVTKLISGLPFPLSSCQHLQMVEDGRMLQLLQILLQASHTLQRMLQKILRLLTFYLKREYFYIFSLTLDLTMY